MIGCELLKHRVWSEFSNSARNDKQKFLHWTKVGTENLDYPWARKNFALQPIQYTDKEYEDYLQVRFYESLWYVFCVCIIGFKLDA